MDASVKTKKPGTQLERARKGESRTQRRHQVGRHHRRRPDGQRHRPRGRARRLRRRSSTTSRRRRVDKARCRPSSATWRARSRAASSPKPRCRRRLKRIRVRARPATPSARPTSSSRRPPRTRRVKRKIFTDLCPSLKKSAMLATNTSSISITRLASATDRPERFIGMHFMNPVPMMQLVELIRGIATEDETFGLASELRREPRQDHRGLGGLPGLHRQPHPAADDQRGGLHAV